jgi:hypothetical protein
MVFCWKQRWIADVLFTWLHCVIKFQNRKTLPSLRETGNILWHVHVPAFLIYRISQNSSVADVWHCMIPKFTYMLVTPFLFEAVKGGIGLTWRATAWALTGLLTERFVYLSGGLGVPEQSCVWRRPPLVRRSMSFTNWALFPEAAIHFHSLSPSRG